MKTIILSALSLVCVSCNYLHIPNAAADNYQYRQSKQPEPHIEGMKKLEEH